MAVEIGSRATAHTVDVTRPEDLEALAEKVFTADGRVDILHNTAGIGHGGDIEETTIEDWQRVIGINLSTAVSCAANSAEISRRSRRSTKNAARRRLSPGHQRGHQLGR
ncbi:MAG: SDR family oxidoreductase [Mycobacterium sp.]